MSTPNLGAGDNPAARLWNFFADFQAAYSALRPQGVPTIAQALARTYDLQWPADRARLMRLAAETVDLPDAVVRSVTEAPDNPFLVKAEILAPADSWRAATESLPHFSHSSDVLLASVNSSTQENLRYCARLLGGVTSLPPLPVGEMATLMARTNEFLEEVLAAELSPELTGFLVGQLESIREALLKARTGGAEALLDGYATVASRTYRRRNRGDAASAEAPGMWDRLRLLVHELAVVAALAADLTGGPANVVTLTDALNADQPSVIVQVTTAPEEDSLPQLNGADRPAIEGPPASSESLGENCDPGA